MELTDLIASECQRDLHLHEAARSRHLELCTDQEPRMVQPPLIERAADSFGEDSSIRSGQHVALPLIDPKSEVQEGSFSLPSLSSIPKS